MENKIKNKTLSQFLFDITGNKDFIYEYFHITLNLKFTRVIFSLFGR